MKKIITLLLALSYSIQSLCIPGLKKAMAAKPMGLKAALEEKPKAHIAYEQVPSKRIDELPNEIKLILLKDYLSKEDDLSQEMFNLGIDIIKENPSYKKEILRLLIAKAILPRMDFNIKNVTFSTPESTIDQYIDNYKGQNKEQIKKEAKEEADKIVSKYTKIYQATKDLDFELVIISLNKKYVSINRNLVWILGQLVSEILESEKDYTQTEKIKNLLIKIIQRLNNVDIDLFLKSQILLKRNKVIKTILSSGFKPNIEHLRNAIEEKNIKAAKIILKSGLRIGNKNGSFRFDLASYSRTKHLLGGAIGFLIEIGLIKALPKIAAFIDKQPIALIALQIIPQLTGLITAHVKRQYSNPIFEKAKNNPTMLKLLLKYTD